MRAQDATAIGTIGIIMGWWNALNGPFVARWADAGALNRRVPFFASWGRRRLLKAPSWQRRSSPHLPQLASLALSALGGGPHSGGAAMPLRAQMRGRGTGMSLGQWCGF